MRSREATGNREGAVRIAIIGSVVRTALGGITNENDGLEDEVAAMARPPSRASGVGSLKAAWHKSEAITDEATCITGRPSSLSMTLVSGMPAELQRAGRVRVSDR